jgi:hypothetical protein
MKDPKVRQFFRDMIDEIERGEYVPRGRWVELPDTKPDDDY